METYCQMQFALNYNTHTHQHYPYPQSYLWNKSRVLIQVNNVGFLFHFPCTWSLIFSLQRSVADSEYTRMVLSQSENTNAPLGIWRVADLQTTPEHKLSDGCNAMCILLMAPRLYSRVPLLCSPIKHDITYSTLITDRISIGICIHNRHPITRPHGGLMGCLLWGI